MIQDDKPQLKGRAAIAWSYRSVFDNPEGEKVLIHLGKASGAFSSNFVRGDPYETAFREGMRMLYLSILKMVKKDMKDLNQLAEKGFDNG